MKLAVVKLVVALMLIGIMASACVYQQENKSVIELEKPQWPAAPAKARVTYIKMFSTPEDLGIRKGFWQRIGEFFTGTEEIQLIRPMAITTVDQVIFVADPGAKGIHRFDKKNSQYDLIKIENDQILLSPVSITADGEGGVYFSDSALAKVFYIKPGEDIAFQMELDAEIEQPTGLAVDKKTGHFYVVDTLRHQVLKFNQAGEHLESIGRRGNAKGEFNFPTMVWCNGKGELFVSDSLNFRVQIFNKHGRYISEFGKHGSATGYQARPKGVATDQLGNVYVVDSLFHNLQLYNQSGKFLLNVGEQGQSLGQFWLPTGIHIDQQQKIYIADSYNHRVQIMQSHAGVR